ncbi:MAG: carboxypeptidase M32 [Candidatus Nanohaloarchaea archaeon]
MGYEEIVEEYSKILKLRDAQGLLGWDEETKMPEKGIEARTQQNSALSEVTHDLLTSEKLGKLIEKAEQQELDEQQEAVLREIRKDHERSKKMPRELVKQLSEQRSKTVEAWKRARRKEDFSVFAGELQEMVELQRKYAAEIDADKEPYEVLYEDYEPYFPLEDMEDMIERLKHELSELVDEVRENGREIETEALEGDFPEEEQRELSREILELMGYDFERGRIDESEHPFTSGNQFDARIATRFDEENIAEAVKIALHEGGHALYQLGLPQEEYATPLGQSRELGVHESQSRLYENHVGKSKEFMEVLLPMLENYFPEFEDVTEQELYESMSQVKTDNLIRVNADEMTYHLHIAVRFDIERKLINGEVEVEELPRLWNEKMEEYLGIAPETPSEGVMQDIHWAFGNFGYFPTYTLGSVLAAQVYDAAEEEIDSLNKKISEGELVELREWLRENVHRHGRRFRTSELVERATGEEPTADYFLEHVKERYRGLYEL